jgi:hypothetical protein
MPAISYTGRGHGPLLQKIAEHPSEQIYGSHSNYRNGFGRETLPRSISGTGWKNYFLDTMVS